MTRRYRARRRLYVLVYEGKNNKTEKIYFQHYNVGEDFVIKDDLSELKGTDPASLYAYAESQISAYNLESSLGDHVFIVSDIDHRQDHVSFIKKHAKTNKMITWVASFPCFEQWILMHFEDPDFSLTGDEVIKRLRLNYITNYDKNRDVYPPIESKRTEAKERCSEYHSKHRIPGTISVGELVSLLEKKTKIKNDYRARCW
jgi:hypothetical protein